MGAAYVMAAPDPVACWGAAELMRREFSLPITAITGPATDNEVGQVYIRTGLGLPAHNARRMRRGCWRSCGRRWKSGRTRLSAIKATGYRSRFSLERTGRRIAGSRMTSAVMKIAVIGAAGYVGGELLRLLFQHPDVSECIATSRSQAGKPIADVHPALGGLSDARFSGASAGEASRGARRRVSLPRTRRVVQGGWRGVRRGPRTRRRPCRGLPGERSPALRTVLRGPRGAGAGEPLHLRTRRRAGAICEARPRSPRQGVSRRPRSWHSIHSPARDSTCLRRSSGSRARAVRGCSPGRLRITRCGHTTCSRTPRSVIATRRRCCRPGGNGSVGPTRRAA